MGNAGLDIGCTPTLAGPCSSSSLPRAPGCPPAHAISTIEDVFDPCTPALGALVGRALDPLSDQECADIALVQATTRGEATDVVRALSLGASPNTIAELTLRMGEPSKKGRKGRAAHMTPLMRACELGHEDVVVLLLEARASLLQCDSHGWTPVCHALGAGEVGIAKLVAQHPGFKLLRQKEICRKLQEDILLKCRSEVSEEEVAAVETALGSGGFLDAVSVSSGRGGDKPDKLTGASPGKVFPLFEQNQDLSNAGSYAYPCSHLA